MSTIINNPTPTEKTVVVEDSGGWVVAVIILLLVIAGGVYWWSHHRTAPQTAQPATINVTLPIQHDPALTQ